MKKNFKGFYEKSGIEERECYLLRENEFVVASDEYKNLSKEEKENVMEKANKEKGKKLEEQELNNPEIARKDLEYSDDDILYSVEIKDKRFYEQVPDAKKYDGYAMLIYSK